jgi:hypothetical protein
MDIRKYVGGKMRLVFIFIYSNNCIFKKALNFVATALISLVIIAAESLGSFCYMITFISPAFESINRPQRPN